MQTSKIDMAKSVEPADIDTFIDNAAWAICSTYHTVLNASPGAAIFGRDMLFDIPFIADWKQIGEDRQCQTDLGNERENKTRVNYDNKVGEKVLIRKDGISLLIFLTVPSEIVPQLKASTLKFFI